MNSRVWSTVLRPFLGKVAGSQRYYSVVLRRELNLRSQIYIHREGFLCFKSREQVDLKDPWQAWIVASWH